MEKYTLVGVNGNAFSVMSCVCDWMRKEGCTREEIDKYIEDAKSSDYNHLLCVSIDMVDKLNNKL